MQCLFLFDDRYTCHQNGPPPGPPKTSNFPEKTAKTPRVLPRIGPIFLIFPGDPRGMAIFGHFEGKNGPPPFLMTGTPPEAKFLDYLA